MTSFRVKLQSLPPERREQVYEKAIQLVYDQGYGEREKLKQALFQAQQTIRKLQHETSNLRKQNRCSSCPHQTRERQASN
jgi:flagellar biosynthesis/type III secretory pathway protein FliH